ncbi:MAG: hypothetical protein A2W31_18445 [Planctomycetes bacterium RBG_16_64_10]|nr:MAG: hypothetical protein A2W31_18445 [Planctomycetes bacterium RBG_16_64_10]
MPAPEPFTDIHCHLLPGLDDGPQDLATALAMARLAARDGTRVVIVTPHQLGRYTSNRGAAIRDQTGLLQQALDEHGIPLRLLPGADVRIDDRLVALVQQGEVLSLADHGRHVLVELPHELYLPLEPLIEQLAAAGLVAILSHPERNRGILARPDVVAGLVDAGCLMQVTAGSLTGQFGRSVQGLAEVLIAGGLVQFVGSDAHATRDRAPVLRPAFDRVAAHTDYQTAIDLLCRNPALVARGQPVPAGRRRVPAKTPTWWGWRRHSAADGTLAAASGPR